MNDQKYQDICQSCGMPMKIDSDYGTKEDDSRSYEYCKHCYQKGKFTKPDITMEQMIKGCVGIMMEYGTKEEEAKKIVEQTVPTLKRWQN